MGNSDTFLIVYICVVAFIIGSVFASFVNCMAGRYSVGLLESITAGRSRCDACGHVLGIADLVPVASYIFLKGRCRYCGEKVSPRNLVSEVTLGVAFSLIGLKACAAILSQSMVVFGGENPSGMSGTGIVIDAVVTMALVCILMAIALVDLDTFEIPNGLILGGIGLWVVTLVLRLVMPEAFVSSVGSAPAYAVVLDELVNGLAGGLIIGGAMLLISIIFDKVTGKESLGGGDIKLFFMVGLFLGVLGGLLNLILSCVMGIVFAFGMKQKRIPFGPSIAAATVVSLLWGQELVAWYIGLL